MAVVMVAPRGGVLVLPRAPFRTTRPEEESRLVDAGRQAVQEGKQAGGADGRGGDVATFQNLETGAMSARVGTVSHDLLTTEKEWNGPVRGPQ
jgi:hypothetical protein